MKDPRPARIAAAVVRQLPSITFCTVGEKWLRRLIRKEAAAVLNAAPNSKLKIQH